MARKQPSHKPEPVARDKQSPGSWVPWPTALKICGVRLRTDSHRRVFLAVFFTSMRYGGKPALLSVDAIVGITKLAPRTVKAALGELRRRGLVTRPRRYKCLQVNLPHEVDATTGSIVIPTQSPRSASMTALPRCNDGCTSPTSINVNFKDSKTVFTPKQLALIADVTAEASAILGEDVTLLEIPTEHIAQLGLDNQTTYKAAYDFFVRAGTPQQARDFVKAVLALRNNPRVQGQELQL